MVVSAKQRGKDVKEKKVLGLVLEGLGIFDAEWSF